MVFNPSDASNWYLTWDEDTADQGKSFQLQVKLNNLTVRDLLSDSINSYITVCRQREGPSSGWELIGKTTTIRDDANPEYPEGFRIFYDQETNLNQDSLKVICYHKREGFSHEEVIGSSTISIRELVRAFGTRVQAELIKPKKNKVVGSTWFLGEPLPNQSPRGGANSFEFKIAAMAPRKSEVKFQVARVFLVISREREDSTWGVVYRSPIVKRHPVVQLINPSLPILMKPVSVHQSELVLGSTPYRKVKFCFYHAGRHGEPHITIGEVVTSVDEILNEFAEDTSLDLTIDGQVIGEFANISRKVKDKHTAFNIEVNYFNSNNDAREIQEKRKNKVLNLDSP